MAENIEKTIGRDSEKATIIKKVANKHGLSIRQVYRVINDESKNEEVFSDYMFLAEGIQELDNQLLQSVNQLVPFNQNTL